MMTAAAASRSRLLTDLLDGLVAQPAPAVPVRSLTLDSRQTQVGTLFLACRGTARHGLAFAEAAVRSGAAAVAAELDEEWTVGGMQDLARRLRVPVVPVPALSACASEIAARFYERPSDRLRVVGVTGTNGKTSVTQFIAQALAPTIRCGVIGTIGYGFPGDLAASTHTTPDAVTVQAMLAELVARRARAVAMEVSSHALHQDRVAAVRFDVAVLTNLTRDHLDYHRTMEAYAEAKARLFRLPDLRCAVINTDDAFGLGLHAETARRLDVISYGLEGAPAHAQRFVVAERVVPEIDGLRLHVRSTWGEGELSTRLLGRFNASNLLAVLGVLLGIGLPFAEALSRLEAVTTVPGRMERFGGDGGPLVVVDYAHTPDALAQALAALREHCTGRLICVFGCGGERDGGKRPLMGEVAEAFADDLVVTDDNPRREDGHRIVRDILDGMRRPERALVERRRPRAIAAALARAQGGDVVLVAGKGHEDYQQVGDLKLPYSDRETVARLLAGEPAE
jgi:UDP-N-acetylmuramoyl-L-alanyl-D-glutamate--2,6-diaminopimelate ligase